MATRGPWDCPDAEINRVLAQLCGSSSGKLAAVLKDGTYAAWFKIPVSQGTGIVADSKVGGATTS
jgi:hypothetical protein